MNKKETIKLFLENGFQLSQEALTKIQKKPDVYLEEIRKFNPRPFIITMNHLKEIDLEENGEKIKFDKNRDFSPIKGKL
ncbi:MAG: hypothetical protein GF368_05895, partial [Candidatus Aenigmarchaeota archaeon]|nr:hypothetical protein [Candidatus Aenigmarchaeota archaeon]